MYGFFQMHLGYSRKVGLLSNSEQKPFRVFGNGGFHSSVHGQSPDHKEMRALLAMSGPDVREKNQILEIPQNIDLYPLLCHLLQVEATPNNGSWSIIGNALQIPILYNMK